MILNLLFNVAGKKFMKQLTIMKLGHYSHNHLGFSMTVLGFCSNSDHLLLSMRKVNFESFSTVASTSLFTALGYLIIRTQKNLIPPLDNAKSPPEKFS